MTVTTDSSASRLLEGTASATGQQFFRALVESVCRALGTLGAWVALYLPLTRELQAIAMKMGEWMDGMVYGIRGTSCETAIDEGRQLFVPDRVVELYPSNVELRASNAVSYLGVPLFDLGGEIRCVSVSLEGGVPARHDGRDRARSVRRCHDSGAA